MAGQRERGGALGHFLTLHPQRNEKNPTVRWLPPPQTTMRQNPEHRAPVLLEKAPFFAQEPQKRGELVGYPIGISAHPSIDLRASGDGL